MHSFLLTAWVSLRDHWQATYTPVYPHTPSLVVKSVKTSSMMLVNRRRAE
jgi:hypothetical protein